MLTALRREVQLCLAAVPVRRKPALRRAGSPEALLATDLPLAADEAAVAAFTASMEAAGWRVWPEHGWLMLDHALPCPDAADDVHARDDEAAACLWLLRRHPGGNAPAAMLRTLAKAAEEGTVTRLCAAWHREFAHMLREHRPLPGALLPYLTYALSKEEEA